MSSSVKILGNKIDCFKSYRILYDDILDKIKAGQTGERYITVNNVHTMMEGFRDTSYQEIINKSFLSIPDGKPLQIVGRLKGNKEISRLFGPTVMEKFVDWGRQDGVRHFFFGSSQENLQKLKKVIEEKYPATIICGMISPPFGPMSEWNNDFFIQKINETKPDFIWVGLGAPKQESWMYNQFAKIDKGILIGIGAGFDYLAGNTKHAPDWMKRFALEWLYRLIQEPRRLWKRYCKTIPQFMFFAFFDVLDFKHRVKKKFNKN